VGDSVRIHLTYVYLVFFPHPFPLTFAEDLPQSLGMIPGFINSLTSLQVNSQLDGTMAWKHESLKNSPQQ